MRAHFRVVPYEPYEIVTHPFKALSWIAEYGYFEGDCDDASTFIAAIAVPGTAYLEAILTNRSYGFSHVYAVVEGKIIDPVVKIPTGYRDAIERMRQRV